MRTFTFTVFAKTDKISTLRFLGPDGKAIGERDLAQEKIDALIREVESGYRVAAPRLEDLGTRLYEWLDGPTERWLELALPGPDGLALHIDVAERLRHLPWELLRAHGVFLCGNPHRPFTPVRRALGDRREVSRPNRPLRVLFMACSPEGVKPVLDYEGEEGLILETTRRHPIELVVEESGSLEGLREQILARDAGHYDVVHVTGHAGLTKEGRPCFVMEDELGFAHEATADDIARAFDGRWPRLVFLSGCRTGQATDLGGLPSLCEAIVRAGAPAVLGWALPVGDLTASQAAAVLYDHLAVGHRLDEAVARARQNILESKSPYWHLLRLYSDASGLGELVTPTETPDRELLGIRDAAQEFLDAGSKVEVCTRGRFVGRRRPLQRCLRVLRSQAGDPSHAEGVLLHGMGGLGKSSLAARLCERMRGHKRIVLVGRIDETALLAAAEGQRGGEAIQVLNEPGRTLRQRVRRLLEGPLRKAPVLFVFDDFEHSLEASGSGLWILRRDALEVLDALLAGIRATASASRILVTSRYAFPLPGPARLYEEGVESMRGAEWAKKLAQLPAMRALEKSDAAVAERAEALCAGNPRLAERIARVVGAGASDVPALLAAMGKAVAEFREEIFLRTLLDQQDAECRRVVAAISVYEVPVDLGAAQAAAGAATIQKPLERAVAVGLVESGKDLETGDPRFHVSGLLASLLMEALTDDEWTEARRRGARHLHACVWKGGGGIAEVWAVEIHRLALTAGESAIALEIGASLARAWVNAARYREAENICTESLTLGDDYRLLHSRALARGVLGLTPQAISDFDQSLRLCSASSAAEENAVTRHRAAIMSSMARMIAQQGEVKRALELWQQSLVLQEQVGDVEGKAATLNNMAGVIARQGEVKRALDMWQQSLVLSKQIGDVKGQAATLGNIAGVIARQGEVKRALDLWQQSLVLREQIGDVKGQAATLGNIAGVIARQGEVKRALDLWQQSLVLHEQIGDVKGKATALGNIAGETARQGEVKRALDLWQQSLVLHEQIGDVQGKATTLGNMAGEIARQGEVKRALDLWQQSLVLKEQIGDVEGKAATLNNMAWVIAQQGDVKRALDLWQQSLVLQEQIGDVEGQAATLNNMAGVIAQQGEVKRALNLWQESLVLRQQIGDVRGQAATLANLAWAAEKEGDVERQHQLNTDAAKLLASVSSWRDLSTVLRNLGSSQHPDAGRFLAQAVWLSLRVEAAPQDVVELAAALIERLGASEPAAPLLATTAMFVATRRAEGHLRQQEITGLAASLVNACAAARKVEPEGIREWLNGEGLLDPGRFLPALERALEEHVGKDGWLFDRSAVPPPSWLASG